MVERLKYVLTFLLVISITVPFILPGQARAQEEAPVVQMMERMSNAAKVGQLFVVTFPGTAVTDEASITELIEDYHVGGVVLDSQNGNIINEGDTLTQVATLTSDLQESAWQASQTITETTVGQPPFVPLFIAVNHEGNGMPYTSIISGTTALPSEMALGATWNLSHTASTGRIVGHELSALGVNMLLGPSLDVLETPKPESTGDLGVRAFGGEPFWVGQMGQAYIQGVHEGSAGRIAVMPKHFPGLGASDRSLDREVATIQRTLEKLRQVDLAPFFAVAQAENSLMQPDGLMTSHIRFRGLEGGRFVTTRPISVDSQVLQHLLSLPELEPWREAGGVTISDGLGVRALRRFYDPSEQSFNGRRIAQEAFLAGNDLLILSQFALSEQWGDHLDNVKSTITFFQEKYESDAAFQSLVDEAVARILRLKMDLYEDSFTLASAQPAVETIDEVIKPDRETVAAIARDAVTLLYPPSSDLVPSPPGRDERVVIFTDSRAGLPCAACDSEPYISPLKLEQTLVRLYGPDATGQIDPRLIESFMFEDLDAYLTEDLPMPTASGGEVITSPFGSVAAALQQADWVIFAMLDVTDDVPQSKAVKHFLAERAGALQGPELVVLAYDAPYYLDATEIGKLSAYYVAYSRVEPFIETSVRMLFGEFASIGAPPINVSGVNYDLLSQTAPDPDQSISVFYEVSKLAAEEATPEPTEEIPTLLTPSSDGESPPEPELEQGDELRLYTDQILDRNGHIVPDGTPIQFIFTYPEEGLERSETVATRGGVAEATVTLNRTGQLDISVQADPALRAVALQVTIREGRPATVVTPTPPPTPEPTPTLTPAVEPTAEGTPTPTYAPVGEDEQPSNPVDGIGILDLIFAVVSALFVGGLGYYVMRLGNEPTGRSLRMALWGMSGGLACYVVYALLQTWSDVLEGRGGAGLAGAVALVGGVITSLVIWMEYKRYIKWPLDGAASSSK